MSFVMDYHISLRTTLTNYQHLASILNLIMKVSLGQLKSALKMSLKLMKKAHLIGQRFL